MKQESTAPKANTNFEVERKYRLTPALQGALPPVMQALGFVPTTPSTLTDIYFTDSARDFIRAKVCLRLRACNGQLVSLDYKGRTDETRAAGKHAKEEIELALAAGTQAVTGTALLTALGFVPYVTVQKRRTPHHSPRFQSLTLDWDEVQHVGTFLELEVMVTEASAIKAAEAQLHDAAAELGLSDDMLAGSPYRDLVAAALGLAA